VKRLALAAMLTAGAVALTGCYSRPGPPDVAEEQFSAAQITVEPVNGQYVVVAQVGSPGYALVLDSTWDAYRGKHVYVTIRRPDPRFTYAQVVTDLRLLTAVETKESITVFARTAERDEEDIEDEYRMAAQALVATPQNSEGLIVK
jgi:acyl CoA:acetate/3-ketoacid CoA transferase alpha subunit